MERRDPFKDVANTSSNNEPQEPVDETPKQPEMVAGSSSDNKENGFSPKPQKSDSDRSDLGCGSSKSKDTTRRSILKSFDPLYTESPQKGPITPPTTSSQGIRPQVIIEDSDESEVAESSVHSVEVSDDDKPHFVGVSAVTDETPVSSQVSSEILDLEESLLKFYTPENTYVARQKSDSESSATSVDEVTSQLSKVQESTSSAHQAKNDDQVLSTSQDLDLTESEIVSAISRKKSSGCDIILIRSKFTITESELENYTILRERFCNENRESYIATRQENVADAIETNSRTSVSEIRNISPERSNAVLESEVTNDEHITEEQQTEDIPVAQTSQSTEKGESSDDSQESKVTVIETRSVPEVGSEDKSSNSCEGTTAKQFESKENEFSTYSTEEEVQTKISEEEVIPAAVDKLQAQKHLGNSLEESSFETDSHPNLVKEADSANKYQITSEESNLPCESRPILNKDFEEASQHKLETESSEDSQVECELDPKPETGHDLLEELNSQDTSAITPEESKFASESSRSLKTESADESQHKLETYSIEDSHPECKPQPKPEIESSLVKESEPEIKLQITEEESKPKSDSSHTLETELDFTHKLETESPEQSQFESEPHAAVVTSQLEEESQDKLVTGSVEEAPIESEVLPKPRTEPTEEAKLESEFETKSESDSIIEDSLIEVGNHSESVQDSHCESDSHSLQNDKNIKKKKVESFKGTCKDFKEHLESDSDSDRDTDQNTGRRRCSEAEHRRRICEKKSSSVCETQTESEQKTDSSQENLRSEDQVEYKTGNSELYQTKSEQKSDRSQENLVSEDQVEYKTENSELDQTKSEQKSGESEVDFYSEIQKSEGDSKCGSLSEQESKQLLDISAKDSAASETETSVENTSVDKKSSESDKPKYIKSEEHCLDSGVDSIEESYIYSTKDQVGNSENDKGEEHETYKEDSSLTDGKLNNSNEVPEAESVCQVISHEDYGPQNYGDQNDEQPEAIEKPVQTELEDIKYKVESLTDITKDSIKSLIDTDSLKAKMADLSVKLSEQQQENSDLKLQLNAIQQAKASLELEIRQKEEIIIKAQAESMKSEQSFKQEIQQLREKLKENSKLIEKDSSKELEDQLKEAKAREAKAIAELNQKTKDIHNYEKILEEYENTLATRLAESQSLREEHETANRHLANIELAFSDLHQKYERAKAIIEGFKSNEETLKASLQAVQKTCEQHEERYEALKAHAKGQIEKSNKEILMLRDKYENDMNKLKAIIKRLEIKCSSLEVSVQQKTEECAALSALCEEVTGKKV